MRLQPNARQQSTEKIDVHAAMGVAQSVLPAIPDVPGTIVVTKELWAPEGDNAEAFRAMVRDQQQTLSEHFQPGQIITVDAPHNMISVVPDQIAATVLEIVRP